MARTARTGAGTGVGARRAEALRTRIATAQARTTARVAPVSTPARATPVSAAIKATPEATPARAVSPLAVTSRSGGLSTGTRRTGRTAAARSVAVDPNLAIRSQKLTLAQAKALFRQRYGHMPTAHDVAGWGTHYIRQAQAQRQKFAALGWGGGSRRR